MAYYEVVARQAPRVVQGGRGRGSGLGWVEAIAAILGPIVEGGASIYATTVQQKQAKGELKQRKAEKAELDRQAAQRKQDLAARTKPLRKQYAINLWNADTAGLPEAMAARPEPRSSAAASKAALASHDDIEPDKDLDKAASRDIILEETLRILGDYVTLSSDAVKPNLTAVGPVSAIR